MPPTKTEPTLLEKLLDQRTKRIDEWSEVVNAFEEERATFEARSTDADEAKRPTDEERDAYSAAKAAFIADTDQRKVEIQEFDSRIEDQREQLRRREEVKKEHESREQTHMAVESEPLTYRRDNGRGIEGVSYFRDLASALIGDVNFANTSKQEATERLIRHSQEMAVEIPKKIAGAEKRATEKVALAESRGQSDALAYDPFHRGAVYNPIEKRVEPNRTDGYGGYFIQLVAA